MEKVMIVCPVFGCGNEFEGWANISQCPKCGFCEQQVHDMGTNDPEELKKYCGFCRGKCKGEHYISPSTIGY